VYCSNIYVFEVKAKGQYWPLTYATQIIIYTMLQAVNDKKTTTTILQFLYETHGDYYGKDKNPRHTIVT